jgi:hypothetical protein
MNPEKLQKLRDEAYLDIRGYVLLVISMFVSGYLFLAFPQSPLSLLFASVLMVAFAGAAGAAVSTVAYLRYDKSGGALYSEYTRRSVKISDTVASRLIIKNFI